MNKIVPHLPLNPSQSNPCKHRTASIFEPTLQWSVPNWNSIINDRIIQQITLLLDAERRKEYQLQNFNRILKSSAADPDPPPSLHFLLSSAQVSSTGSFSIPANSHALGVSLTPAGWIIRKRRSHADSRLRANFSGLIENCEVLPSCLTQFPKIR